MHSCNGCAATESVYWRRDKEFKDDVGSDEWLCNKCGMQQYRKLFPPTFDGRVCNNCGLDKCKRWSVDLILNGWLCQKCTRPQRIEMGLWGNRKAYMKAYAKLALVKMKTDPSMKIKYDLKKAYDREKNAKHYAIRKAKREAEAV